MTVLLAWGMMTLALALAARSVRVSGHSLKIALPTLAFGVGSINPLIEAVVFGVMPIADVPTAMAVNLVVFSGLSLAAIAALGKWHPSTQVFSAPRLTLLRLVAAAACYTLLYLAAGMAVFPFVKDFYATKTLPAISTLVGLQLVRGLLYVLYAWPWLRLGPRNAGLILGAVYAVLGGVAPLIVDDNTYMPYNVRMAHLVEVGISNFVFGLVVGKLFDRCSQAVRKQLRHSATSA